MIDQVLQNHNIEPDKLYATTVLYDLMFEIGLTNMKRESFTTDFINRNIAKGLLVLPTIALRKRFFTGKQMEGIIRAFLPGGKGFYDYEKDSE